MKSLDHIIKNAVTRILEQDDTGAKNPPKETRNAPSDADTSPFTPAEERFLGKFDAYGAEQLGIIYSISDIGIREFVARSGNDLNVSSGILLNLLRQGIIKIVPYTGHGRNTDYTIELQLSLDDVKGLGKADQVAATTDAAGGVEPGMETGTEPAATEPGPEVSWVIPYGDLLSESARVAKLLAEAKTLKIDVDADKSRFIQKMPRAFVGDLERIISKIAKHATTAPQKQRMVADVLDNLAANLNLTPKQVQRSYEYHRTQKRLQESLNNDTDDYVVMLMESLNEQRDSPEKTFLINRYGANLPKQIDNALQFWLSIETKSGILNMHDYDLWRDAIKSRLLNSTPQNQQALIIEAIAIILNRAKTGTDDKQAMPYVKFLEDWEGEDWADSDVLSGDRRPTLSMVLGSGQYIDRISSEPWFANFNQTLNRSGVGQIFPDNPAGKRFIPNYSQSQINGWVLKLIAPYQEGADLGKIKSPKFSDTLSVEEKRKRGQQAVIKINQNMKSRITGNPPKGYKMPDITDWTNKSWVDEKGIGYAFLEEKDGSIVRIYPDGKSVWLNPKNGKVVQTDTWIMEWDPKKNDWKLLW